MANKYDSMSTDQFMQTYIQEDAQTRRRMLREAGKENEARFRRDAGLAGVSLSGKAKEGNIHQREEKREAEKKDQVARRIAKTNTRSTQSRTNSNPTSNNAPKIEFPELGATSRFGSNIDKMMLETLANNQQPASDRDDSKYRVQVKPEAISSEKTKRQWNLESYRNAIRNIRSTSNNERDIEIFNTYVVGPDEMNILNHEAWSIGENTEGTKITNKERHARHLRQLEEEAAKARGGAKPRTTRQTTPRPTANTAAPQQTSTTPAPNNQVAGQAARAPHQQEVIAARNGAEGPAANAATRVAPPTPPRSSSSSSVTPPSTPSNRHSDPAPNRPNGGGSNLLDELDKSIDVSEGHTITFRRPVIGRDGKRTTEFNDRRIAGEKERVDSSRYFEAGDIQKLIESKIAENNANNKKTSITMGGTGGQLKIEVEPGKKLDEKQLDELNKFFAAQSKIVMPAEKSIDINKGGWFRFKSISGKESEKGLPGPDVKTQLAADKRKDFTQEDKETLYVGLNQMELGENDFCDGPVPPEEVIPPRTDEKGKKKCMPKWVKALAIGGAVAAGVATVGLLAPYIMPAMSACWTMLPSAVGPALHTVQTGIAGASALVGNPLTFMPMSGRWLDGAGTLMNAVPQGMSLGTSILGVAGGVAAAATAGILTYKAITGIYKTVNGFRERKAAERAAAERAADPCPSR